MCIYMLLFFLAGTISGEEIPVVSKANIKEYRDSFSCEKFNFRSNPNITFYVYVSNFSWPIKIQVSTTVLHLWRCRHLRFTCTEIVQIVFFACCIICVYKLYFDVCAFFFLKWIRLQIVSFKPEVNIIEHILIFVIYLIHFDVYVKDDMQNMYVHRNL